MTQINTASLPQFTDLVKRTFTNTVKSLPNIMRNAPFVKVEKIASNTGLYKRFGERLHRSEYGSFRAEGDQSKVARVQYGYEKDLAVSTISSSISITQLMREGGKNQDIIDSVLNLGLVVDNRMDLDLSHRFTFATATTYVDQDGRTTDISTWDGLALASASHTLTGSSTTYSTVITGNPVFSKSGLTTAEKSLVEWTFDNLGIKMTLTGNRVILTTDDPDTCNLVKELMNATADVSTSNSWTYNVYKSKYQHVIAPRIATTAGWAPDSTKAKYWALIAPDHSDMYLGILKEASLKTPMDGNNGEDISSGNWTYVADGIYGICTVSARAFRVSTGAWS